MINKCLIHRIVSAILFVAVIGGCSTNARYEKLTQEAIADYNAGRFSESLNKFAAAAKNKNTQAFYYLGRQYHLGQGVAKNHKLAAEYYQKAVDLNDYKSMNNLALLYEYGSGVKKDLSRAESLYLNSAKGGIAQATNNVAFLYYRQNSQSNKAFQWINKSAMQGFPEAENSMGVYYFQGKVVAKDYAKAAQWFTKAAGQGNANGETNLGLSYLYGYGITANKSEGIHLLKKAVEKNQPLAQLLLGQSYMKGDGVRTNLREAKRLCGLAHKNGQAGAQRCLSGIRQEELASQRRYNQQAQRKRRSQKTDTGDWLLGIAAVAVGLLAADAIIDSFSSDEPKASSGSSSSCREKAANRISQCWSVVDSCNTVGCSYKLNCSRAKNGATGRSCMGFWERLNTEMGSDSGDFYCDTENAKNRHEKLEVVINKICQ